jgi:hypothetical protein
MDKRTNNDLQNITQVGARHWNKKIWIKYENKYIPYKTRQQDAILLLKCIICCFNIIIVFIDKAIKILKIRRFVLLVNATFKPML